MVPGQAIAETLDVCDRAADHLGKTRKSGETWHTYKEPQELWLLPYVLQCPVSHGSNCFYKHEWERITLG